MAVVETVVVVVRAVAAEVVDAVVRVEGGSLRTNANAAFPLDPPDAAAAAADAAPEKALFGGWDIPPLPPPPLKPAKGKPGEGDDFTDVVEVFGMPPKPPPKDIPVEDDVLPVVFDPFLGMPPPPAANMFVPKLVPEELIEIEEAAPLAIGAVCEDNAVVAFALLLLLCFKKGLLLLTSFPPFPPLKFPPLKPLLSADLLVFDPAPPNPPPKPANGREVAPPVVVDDDGDDEVVDDPNADFFSTG